MHHDEELESNECFLSLIAESHGDQPATYTALLNGLEKSNPKLLGMLWFIILYLRVIFEVCRIHFFLLLFIFFMGIYALNNEWLMAYQPNWRNLLTYPLCLVAYRTATKNLHFCLFWAFLGMVRHIYPVSFTDLCLHRSTPGIFWSTPYSLTLWVTKDYSPKRQFFLRFFLNSLRCKI